LEFRIFPTPGNINTLKFRTRLIEYMLNNKAGNGADILIDLRKGGGLYEILRMVYTPTKIAEKIKEMRQLMTNYSFAQRRVSEFFKKSSEIIAKKRAYKKVYILP
jgi:hypothetical protein